MFKLTCIMILTSFEIGHYSQNLCIRTFNSSGIRKMGLIRDAGGVCRQYLDLHRSLDSQLITYWCDIYRALVVLIVLEAMFRSFSMLIPSDGLIGSDGDSQLQSIGAIWLTVVIVVWLLFVFRSIGGIMLEFHRNHRSCVRCDIDAAGLQAVERQNVLLLLGSNPYEPPLTKPGRNERNQEIRLSWNLIIYFYRGVIVVFVSFLFRFAFTTDAR